MFRLFPAPAMPDVFAIGTGHIQVTWADGPHDVRVSWGDQVVERHLGKPAGAVTIGGLPPSTAFEARFTGRGRTTTRTGETLARPEGEVVARVATMNDLHLGRDRFGLTGRIERAGSAYLCARTALEEAAAWGADHVVVKGDITNSSEDGEWAEATSLLAELDSPFSLMMGNHETAHDRFERSRDAMHRIGGYSDDRVRTIDLGGARVVLADVTVPGGHAGSLEGIADDIVAAVADTDAALVVHHHQLYPVVNTYPRGVHGRAVLELLRRVRDTNPNTVFSSGHTHRHRRMRIRGITVTELGSTKDYPGTWCGYTFYEGGIEATVHRLGDPDAVAWLDRTAGAVAGVWGRWSPGRLHHRCFTQAWV